MQFAASLLFKRNRLYRVAFVVVVAACLMLSCGGRKDVVFLGTPDGPPAAFLIWSPSGQELAVTGLSYMSNSSALHILDVPSRKMHLVLSEDYGNLVATTWTPNGQQLVFFANSSRSFKEGSWTVDISGSEPPTALLSARVLAWSQANEMVVSTTERYAQQVTLTLRNAGTNEEEPIYSGSGVTIDKASWASDGSKLAFVLRTATGSNRIYVYQRSTGTSVELMPDADVRDPSWSPDGTMLAYALYDARKPFPSYALHIRSADGTCDVAVPGNEGYWSPEWSPDGRYIAFIGSWDGIYLLDLRGVFGNDISPRGLGCT